MTADLVRMSGRNEAARRLKESMRRQIGEFCAYLEQDDVIEISLNADGRIWVDRLGQLMRPVGMMRGESIDAGILQIKLLLTAAADPNSPWGHPGTVAPTSGTDFPAASGAKL